MTNTGRILATSDTAIGKIRPVPAGCERKWGYAVLSALNMNPPCPAASALPSPILARNAGRPNRVSRPCLNTWCASEK